MKDYTCAVCGEPTSMGWAATASYIVRPACRKCYDMDSEDFEELVHVPFPKATSDELLDGHEGMKNIEWFDGTLLVAELARRGIAPRWLP